MLKTMPFYICKNNMMNGPIKLKIVIDKSELIL